MSSICTVVLIEKQVVNLQLYNAQWTQQQLIDCSLLNLVGLGNSGEILNTYGIANFVHIICNFTPKMKAVSVFLTLLDVT